MPAAMSTVPITISHAGSKYPLDLNLASSGLEFKEQIYQVTGVPVDRSVHHLSGTSRLAEMEQQPLGDWLSENARMGSYERLLACRSDESSLYDR